MFEYGKIFVLYVTQANSGIILEAFFLLFTQIQAIK